MKPAREEDGRAKWPSLIRTVGSHSLQIRPLSASAKLAGQGRDWTEKEDQIDSGRIFARLDKEGISKIPMLAHHCMRANMASMLQEGIKAGTDLADDVAKDRQYVHLSVFACPDKGPDGS